MTRFVAFHLPQFHPIPENDAWWGEGFTDWTNVRRARRLYPGHRQPRVPAALGYYDLRDPAAREAQAQLAVAHGLAGFCYWHYWFEGRRLLERPFDQVLTSGRPTFPFCLAWANESWSRRWLGEPRDVMIEQTYSADDDAAHARWLTAAFADPRYLRVGDRPLFCVYRPRDLPEPRRTTETIRAEAVRAGLPDPYLIGIDAHCPGTDCRPLGFDSTLAFEPQLGVLPGFGDDGAGLARLVGNLGRGVASARLHVHGYAEARELMCRIPRDFPTHPCVFVSWDNTPRRGRDGVVVTGSTARRFEAALAAAATAASAAADDELVFVNAWNEWAEGNYLEPDQDNGRAHLEAMRRVARGQARPGPT